MRMILFAGLLGVLSAGCTGKFAVKQVDTEFSETKDKTFYSVNNRISLKSIAGGVHINTEGVYLDPYIVRDASTGGVVILGLNLSNRTSFNTMTGRINQLGTIQEAAFKIDGDRLIVSQAVIQETATDDLISYNSVGRFAGYGVTETAKIPLTKEEFQALAAAQRLEAKITGSRQSVTYREDDILESFVANLRYFYENYVVEVTMSAPR